MARCWLVKSEPDCYPYEQLEREGRTMWDGVRNYQARNMLRDQMQLGDPVFFYHSNCKQPGIVGIAEIVRAGYPDHTALDPESNYYDPKSTPEKPIWYMVDVRFVRKLKRTITLDELKQRPELEGMPLVRRGNRLSVMPVSPQDWEFILSLE